jgi:hypothetical protein
VSLYTHREQLGKPECPYMERWILDFKLFSLRLHHWRFGDDPRAHHDHPWNFWVLVLWGSYVDVSPEGRELMPRWSLRYRKAEHQHTVETNGCWTFLICGPEKREWGFWLQNTLGRLVWFKAKRYFLKHGHHPCDPAVEKETFKQKVKQEYRAWYGVTPKL